MKSKNYSLWLSGHIRLAKDILPNLPQKFRCKHGLCMLVFDRGPRFHSVAYYVEKNPEPLHEERHENLCTAAEKMLNWYRNCTEFTTIQRNEETNPPHAPA
ncbi:MAG: hypothetical protein K2M56_09635 [Muribaculaceae bacterium]|nr:hypothetical protein [Muribaculaceae bacterium]